MIVRTIAHALCALLSFSVVALAKADHPSTTNPDQSPHERASKPSGQSGLASIYGYPGDKTAGGNKAANGESFRASAMTAAHKTMPFGTRVRVTNIANGRSTVVRINDRGPFVKGRIIDLTPAAAGAVGLTTKQGVARVTLTVEE